MAQASVFVLFILILGMLLTIIKMLNYRKSNFLASVIVGTVFFALLFTLSSLFWTKDVAYDVETIKHLEFGWPIPFDIQSQEMYDPPFPYYMDFAWGSYHHLVSKNFYLSFIINFLGTLLIWMLVVYYLSRRERFNN